MPTSFIQPFDFKEIFINYFLGSQNLFVYAFLIVFSFACAKLGVSSKVYLILLGVCSLIVSYYFGMGYYILILVIIGFVVYKAFGRFVN